VVATIAVGTAAVVGSGGGGGTTVETPITLTDPVLERTTASLVTARITIRGPAGARPLVRVDRADPVAPTPGATPEPGEYAPVHLASASEGVTIVEIGGTTYAELAPTPAGVDATLVWDLAADGITGGRRVFLRAVPVGPDGVEPPDALSRAGESPVPVFVGNDPPVLGVGAFESDDERSRTVGIPYALFDTSADAVSITAEASTDGGASFAPAGSRVSQTTNLLSADPTDPTRPFPQSYVWESDRDEGTSTYEGEVVIRMVPFDRFGPGAPVTFAALLDNNAEPSLVIETPERVVSATATVSVTLADVEGDPARILVQARRLDGGVIEDALVSDFLATSPAGIEYERTWSLAGSGLPLSQTTVLRLEGKALDPFGDLSPVTATTAFFVVGNDAPVATISAPLGPTPSDDVTVPVTLFDSTSDLAAIRTEFAVVSVLAGTLPTGVAVAVPREAATNVGDGLLSSRDAQDPGRPASIFFQWQSGRDLPGVDAMVGLRVTPVDEFGREGATTQTAAFRVDNFPNRLPVVSIQTPPRTTDGTTTVAFTANDSDGDLVTVSFRVFDGTGFKTLAGAANPRTVASGSHSFSWSYATDLGSSAGRTTRLQATASDPFASAPPVLSDEFIVGNTPPSVSVTAADRAGLASGEKSGAVAISYFLGDSTADTASIEVSVKTAAGAAAADAGFETAVTPIPNLAENLLTEVPGSSGIPFLHVYVWDSKGTTSTARYEGPVTLRLRARDAFSSFGDGNAVTLAAQIDNNAAPVIFFTTPPARSIDGVASFGFRLTDPDSDPVDVATSFVAVSITTGAVVASGTATIENGGMTGLATSPGGATYTRGFRWSPPLPTTTAHAAAISLALTDPFGDTSASPLDSQPFIVGNDAPEATVVRPSEEKSAGATPLTVTAFDSTKDFVRLKARFKVVSVNAGTLPSGVEVGSFHNAQTNIGDGLIPSRDPLFPTRAATVDFTWRSAQDLDGVDANVIFRITPFDEFDRAGAATDTAEFRVDNVDNVVPVLTLLSASRTADSIQGSVTITFTAVDADGEPVEVDFFADVGTQTADIRRMTLTHFNGSPSTANPVTVTSAGLQTVVWSYAADFGDDEGHRPRAIVTATDPSGSGPTVQTDRFTVGNSPPVLRDVEIVAPPGGEVSGTVVVRFLVRDNTRDVCSVTASYSLAGPDGPFTPISAGAIVGGLVEGLSTDVGQSDEAEYDFSWSTLLEPGVGVTNTAGLSVRLQPSDAFEAGEMVTTTAQRKLRNDTLPSAQVLSVGAADISVTVDGRVPIRFALFDAEADLPGATRSRSVDATVRFSLDGIEFRDATLLPIRGSGRDLSEPDLDGLTARPFPTAVSRTVGVPASDANIHDVIWDAAADGVYGVGEQVVVIEVRPFVTDFDGPGTGDAFGQPASFAVRVGHSTSVFGNRVADLATAPTSVSTVHLEDLDGDGRADLVVAGSESASDFRIRTHRSLGAGFGASAGDVDLPDVPRFRVADFDRDGAKDAIAAFGQRLAVFQGTAAGAFTSTTLAAVIVADGFTDHLATGDVDLDGDVDIVTIAGDKLRTYSADGASPLTLTSTVIRPNDLSRVELADVTGDGFLDAVLLGSDGSGVAAVANDGAGEFTGATIDVTAGIAGAVSRIALGDLDGDGAPDVAMLVPSVSRLRARSLAGGVATDIGSTLVEGEAGSLALGDVNADGNLDALVGTQSNDVRIVLGRGAAGAGSTSGVFSLSEGGPGALVSLGEDFALGDIDGDRRLDIVSAFDETVRIRLGTPPGGLAPGTRLPDPPAAGTPRDPRLVDMTGDARLDLATTYSSTFRFGARIGKPAAAFGDVVDDASAGTVVIAAVAYADVTGDGRADLITRGASDPTLVVIRPGRADGLLGAAVTVSADGGNVAEVAAGDLDRDGDVDLVAATDVSSAIIENLGGGAFSTTPIGAALSDVALADLDDDGFLDVIAESGSSIVVRFSGSAGTKVLATSSTNNVSIDAIDVDGDGRRDIVHLDGSSGIAVHRNLGAELFAPRRVIPAGTNPSRAAYRDLDADGVPEIVAANATSQDLSVLRSPFGAASGIRAGGRRGRGDGRASFAPTFTVQTIDLGEGGRGVTADDASDDGVADLVVAGDNGLRLFVAAAARASEPVTSIPAGRAPEGTFLRRAIVAADIDSLDLPSGSSHRPVSAAWSFTPEGLSLTAASPVTIPLGSMTTLDELTAAVIRVFAFEPDLAIPGQMETQLDVRTGLHRYGRVVEVARRDPGGGALPAGVSAASVDAAKGTITFDVLHLGRFQAFVATSSASAILYRETFDGVGPESSGVAERPPGWSGPATWWQVGSTLTTIPGSPAPGPASAPNLLALALRTPHRDDESVTVTSAPFRVYRDVGTRKTKLRMRRWHDLDDETTSNDVVRLSLVFGTVTTTHREDDVHVFERVSQAVPSLTDEASRLELDVTAEVAAALGGAGLDAAAADCRIELRFTSNASVQRPGLFVDDIEVVLEP
jgi:hypothetical protein